MNSLSEWLKKFSAVIITGGSSGIGKSFIELVARLHPEAVICNLSRRSPEIKLEKLKLRHFPCDLAESGVLLGLIPQVEQTLQSEAPTGKILLINNSGFGAYGAFPGANLANQLGMIEVNISAVVELTARLLPLLRARGGAIMNIASVAGFQPTPWLATYGATKAFVLHWSLALDVELRGTGVRTLAVCPGPTTTQFSRRAGLREGSVPSAFSQSCEAVVLASLRALAGGRTQIVTGWTNKLQVFLGALLPKPWVARVAGRVLVRFRDMQVSA